MKFKYCQVLSGKLFGILILFTLFTIQETLFADVKVNITVPQLREGMEELELLLAENVGVAAGELENMFNSFQGKPKLTEAFGTVVSMSSTLPMLGAHALDSNYSFSLGGYASLYSYTLDIQQISERFSELDPEDDFEIGGNARLINFSLTFPLEKVLPRLSLFTSIGFSNVDYNEYYLDDFFLQTALGYSIFKNRGVEKRFSWTALYLQSGVAYGYSRIGAQIPVGEISQEFDADPDGAGPLPPQSVSILVDPLIDVELLSHIGTFSFAASTGIKLLDSFSFYLGTGCNLSFGQTDININASSTIQVQGYLGELVEVPGTITLDGSVNGSPPKAFLGYLFTGLHLRVSKMFISIPVLYLPNNGLSGGISLGVSY